MGLFRRPVPVDPAEVERLKAEITSLREAIDQHHEAARTLHDKLSTLDDRVTGVDRARQPAHRAGADIDAFAARPASEPTDPEELAAVKEGQVRLANEQARYQIAFREIARLAHELKRPR